MATMHPSAPDARSSAVERRVYAALQQALPADWTVLHGRRVVLPAEPQRHDRVGRRRPIEGEADFAILAPGRGLLVLEVKGGQAIGRDGEGWFSRDLTGQRHPIRDPGAQAQKVLHALKDFLRARRGFPLHPDAARFGFGVALPDAVVAGDVGPELPRAFVLDADDLGDLRRAVERLFDANGIAAAGLDARFPAFVVDALAGPFHLVRPLAARLAEQEERLVALTDEQVRAFELLADHARVAVRGVAGSGKTLVAMAAAARLAASGQRTLFLCFNAPLRAHLAGHARGFPVRTFHAHCLELAERAGLRARIPAQPDQAFYEHEAPRLLAEALQRLPDERWDAVVVDEAQDFRASWWEPTRALLRDPAAGTFICFLDPAQDVYGGAPSAADGFVQARLDYNCRNTARIAAWAGRYAAAPAKLAPGTPDGDAVVERSVAEGDEAAMVAAVAAEVRRLIVDERLDPTRVVVLSAHGRDRSAVWRAGSGADGLPGAGGAQLVPLDAEPTGARGVRFSSVHRFKGLEADAVVLCELRGEGGLGDVVRHIGGTRGKHWLAVVAYGGVD